MNDEVPEVPRESARASFFESASIVWLVPIAALIIALAVAWNNYNDRGPLIRVTFTNADGVSANETELRFRDVTVGIVERLSFPPTLDGVTAHIRLDKEIAEFVDDDAIFWIVRPEITTQGISGLDTVLSGVYIQGIWDAEVGEDQNNFAGLERAPLEALGEGGLLIELRSSRDSGMTENTPIVFKGIEVGRIGQARISADGRWVFSEAIIFRPYDTLVTTATRFWDISGFSFSIGAGGAELNFSSLASLISGGITFDTLISGGDRVRDGSVFEVYPNEAVARNSIFEDSDGRPLTVSVIFEENVSGLTAGAAVEWRGVRIGEVANVTGLVDSDRFGDARVRLVASLEIRPARFGLAGDGTEAETLAFLSERVDEGLRARLTSASLLTGGLKVEFAEVPDPEPATLDLEAQPFPLMPTAESDIADVAVTADGLFQRLAELPVERLLNSAIDFLDNATAVVASEDLRDAPTELLGLLADARGLVGSEEIQAIPDDVSALLQDIRVATTEVRELFETLEAQDGVNRVLAAIDNAGVAAENVATGTEELPRLVDQISALATTLAALPLERLATDAADLMTAAEAIVTDPAAQALPADVQGTIGRLTAILAEIEDAQTVQQLNSALAATTGAAQGLDTTLQEVPDAIAEFEALAARISALPLDTALAEIEGLAAAARQIAESPGAQALPDDLSAALASLQAMLRTLEEEQTILRLTEAVTAARDAATDIGEATDDVPEIVDRIARIAERIEGLPLDRLSEELADVLAEAEVLIRDATGADLPETMSGALAEIDAALSELRDGGLIDNANAALASTRDAADAVAGATEQLPALVENANETLDATERAVGSISRAANDLPAAIARLSRMLDQASVTLAAYSDQSTFSRQTIQTLREVEQAAAAVESLSRALERRPNSIILGR